MYPLYRIAICEHFRLFGSGIQSMLQNSDYFQITCIASNLEELLMNISIEIPDLIILDTVHDNHPGFSTIKPLFQKYPDIPLLLIASDRFTEILNEQMLPDIHGIILCNSDYKELKKAAIRLCRGESYYQTKKIRDYVKKSLRLIRENRRSFKKNGHLLSDRELDVLNLFCRGLTYKEIGNKLFISPRTVETHKNNIIAKLEVRSTAEMISYAAANEYIRLIRQNRENP